MFSSTPPLLLLHGTASSLHTWDGWAAALAPTRRVIRLDMPGFGLTGPAVAAPAKPPFAYSPSDLAGAVAAFLEALEAEEGGVEGGHAGGLAGGLLAAGVDIAGNSLGGSVAWHLAVRHPTWVRRLILVDSAGPYPRGKIPFAFWLAQIPCLKEGLRFVSPVRLVRRTLVDCMANVSATGGAVVVVVVVVFVVVVKGPSHFAL